MDETVDCLTLNAMAPLHLTSLTAIATALPMEQIAPERYPASA